MAWGADQSAVDRRGMTPLELSENEDVEALLQVFCEPPCPLYFETHVCIVYHSCVFKQSFFSFSLSLPMCVCVCGGGGFSQRNDADATDGAGKSTKEKTKERFGSIHDSTSSVVPKMPWACHYDYDVMADLNCRQVQQKWPREKRPILWLWQLA